MNFLFFKKRKGGFTLIELVVTIAIVALISGITLFNYHTFSGGVVLENLAYEVALAVRQAQFFGINVKETGGSFQSGYGVYFDIDNPGQFVLFADINNDHSYDSDDIVVDLYKMTRGLSIQKLCVDSDCSSSQKLSITFIRPDPNAIIKVENNSIEYSEAEIYVGSPDSDVPNKIITVGVAGLISVGTSQE